MAMGARQFCIASDQRRIENFCKHYIGCIVRRDRIAQRPNSLQELPVLRALDIQCDVVFESLLPASSADLFEMHQAAKSLRNFDIYQVRSVETLSRNQCPPLHLDAFLRAKQELEYGRRIDNNQRESRSARTMSVGDILPR